jgi:DNA-binding response OmpR family regulator
MMSGKANILVVDDEQIERQTLSDILRLEGYHVASVPNGEAAIDYVRTRLVDLILLDLRMTGMSGLDVIKVVSQIAPEIEIIMLTAHGSMESAVDALRQRVHDYLLKPASPKQILESVERGLARRETKMQSQQARGPSKADGKEEIRNIANGIYYDVARRAIHSNGQVIYLTPAEGRLLKVLIENPGKVYSHRELVLLVQGYSASQQEAPEILRPLVSRLRLKLSRVKALVKRVVSVRGTGYVYELKPGEK